MLASRAVFLKLYQLITPLATKLRPYHCRTTTFHTVTMATEKPAFQRLPTDVIPVNYNLILEPKLTEFTFKGNVVIEVKVLKPVSCVTLNSCDIEVDACAFLCDTAGSKQQDGAIVYNKEAETVKFTFQNALPGDGKLSLEFRGILNDKMKGFYRSKYTAKNGEERYAATTQFESVDARRAFPCWDEPAHKATFDVTLVVPIDKLALSNMPITSEKEIGTTRIVQFGRTPVMSTYLLAFVVGEFDFVETKDADGILIRVYTPCGKKEQGLFALEVAQRALPFYKDYFSIAYPLPKLDLIAIPDFAAGAMENWGIVTYRETCLLLDPEQSTINQKKWVALVVAHELAHQWFGNLVTMEWWTHLWLNEGFASWMEFWCVDKLFPEFDMWTQFVSMDFDGALGLDALKNSHPIEVAVGHPAEIEEIFDTISYSKGASVIRMLHHFIGDAAFRKGMNLYLTKHSYRNTQTEDLWASLEEASGKPIHKFMSTFTRQMGFPVISATSRMDAATRVLKIKQAKFNADGSAPDPAFQWVVPVTIGTATDPSKHSFLLDSEEHEVRLEGVAEDECITLNPGYKGFYRVQYSGDLLRNLLEQVKQLKLTPSDRLGLHNDMYSLAKAGILPTTDLLETAVAMKHETLYTVWKSISGSIAAIHTLMSHTPHEDSYKLFGRDVFRGVADRIGWDKKEKEDPLDTMLRPIVIGSMLRYGDEEFVKIAKQKFSQHIDGSLPLSPDLRSAVYRCQLRTEGKPALDSLLQLMKKSDLQEEKVRIIGSLGSVKDPQLIQEVLELSMSADIRSQDMDTCVAGCLGTAKGKELAWEFVKKNWKAINDKFNSGFLLVGLVDCTTGGFIDETKIPEIEAFFSANPCPSADRTIKQSCESIKLNSDWLKRDGAAIGQWLSARK